MQNSSSDQLFQAIKFRGIFQKYDKAKDQSERDTLLEKLKRHTRFQNNDVKPSNLKKIRLGDGQSSFSSDEEEDEEMRKIKTVLSYENISTEKELIRINCNLDQRSSWSKIHPRFYPHLDYKAF